MINQDWLFSVLAGVALGVLLYWHLSKTSNIDLQFLFIDTETKQFSIYKTGQMVALFVSTWVLIRETNHDRLNEWLYGGYMLAWTGVNIANRMLNKEAPK